MPALPSRLAGRPLALPQTEEGLDTLSQIQPIDLELADELWQWGAPWVFQRLLDAEVWEEETPL